MPAFFPRIRTWLASTQSRILFLLLLAVAPAFALILFSAYEEHQQALAVSQRQVWVLSQEIHSRMQELLEHSHGTMQNLGRTPEVRGEVAADQCTKLLSDLLQLHDQYEDISVADASGRVRCASKPLREPINLSERKYFKNAIKLRSFVIGDYQTSPVTGKGTVLLAEPVITPQGKISTLVSLSIDLSWLHRMLLRTDLPYGSILTLLDSQGNVLAGYRDKAALIGQSAPEWGQLKAILNESDNKVNEMRLSDGVERLTLVTPLLPPGYGGNLYLWIGVPSNTSHSEVVWMLNRNLLLMAITAILVLGLGRVFASRLLLRRVADLSQAAQRLSSGDLSARTLLPTDESELGQLSAAFNQMGEALVLREARITRYDEELHRANRALGVLSAVNRSLVWAADEPALLDNVCREIVAVGRYPLAWVGYADASTEKRIRIVAKAGDDHGYVDALDLTWDNLPSGSGPTGTAIRTGQSVIIRHIMSDPQYARWRDAALNQGFASTIGLPIVVNGKTIGALRIYAQEADAFDEQEMRLLQELADDLSYGIAHLRDAITRERFERELEHQHNYDALTGLANRTLFQDRLRQALLHASRNQHLVAVLLLDLDRFKAINDTLGHGTGDALLKHVGQCLAACLRTGDTVARLSADEFAVIMNDVGKEEDVAPVARKLLGAVMNPLIQNGHEILITASMGISLFPRDGVDMDGLIQNANAATYRAKSQGGDSFYFYAPEMNERASARFGMEADLRRAMERDQLLMYYQPKVNLASGELSGAEALIRWRHPKIGMVSPAEFIPLAEETGLIRPLGDWVIETVCKQLRRWLDAGLNVPPVALNLSAHQFRQENLAAMIRHCLLGQDLEAKYLGLEITESALMNNLDSAVRTLTELKQLGLKISLDDFGTGYSSLSYLKRFPIDQLKIDQSFVRDLTSDADDMAICVAIINLAHNMKLTVIAEGVETTAQLNYLRLNGCDEIQGYHFSWPLPADDFAQLLREGKTLSADA
ncbi:MAG: EAL domain-containing protein [Sterolibacterium sp.]|nr:EAL domain-containing protein [Sterolibacterium sp.]